MTRAVLRAADVCYRYGRRPALSGVSLSVGRGVTALLGPNAAGKTTLLKVLVGLLEPERGSVAVDGVPTGSQKQQNQQRAQARLGYVPQSPQLPGLARVLDVVGYAAWLSGVPDQDIAGKVEAALADLELADLRRRRVRTLSGGQRQRVALATGVVHEPSVVVLDEPTVGLDPGQRLKVRRSIQQLGQTRAVLLSTHLTEDVMHLAGQVAVLVAGRIRFTGSTADLVAATERLELLEGPGSPFERGYEALVTSISGDAG